MTRLPGELGHQPSKPVNVEVNEAAALNDQLRRFASFMPSTTVRIDLWTNGVFEVVVHKTNDRLGHGSWAGGESLQPKMTYEDHEFRFTKEQWAEVVAWMDDQMLHREEREARMQERDEHLAAGRHAPEYGDRVLHQLWTQAVGREGYDKAKWKDLERLVHAGIEAGRKDAQRRGLIDADPSAPSIDADAFARRHVDLLHENEQLRARHKEQLRIIEEKREIISGLKDSDEAKDGRIKEIVEYIEKLRKDRADIASRYFCLLQYHRNQFEPEATYDEIEMAATGYLYPFKEEENGQGE